MVLLQLIATTACGLFAGAALYVNFVEHPARIEAGIAAALAEFAPSYRRATIMQASLALAGAAAGVGSWVAGAGTPALVGAILLFGVVPFTLIVIFPTNERLLDPALQSSIPEAEELLKRWARLHAVRSALGFVAFVSLLLSFCW